MATAIPPNRAEFTVDAIAEATGGAVVRGGAPTIGVCTDSRALQPGSAFVALAGERFDGHAFVRGAVSQGAGAVVVSRDDMGWIDDAAVVRVADTRVALGDLARAHRVRWAAAAHPSGPRSVVAITGSAGKTTTKGLLARVLAGLCKGEVHSTIGNLNNEVGVPMTLFGLEQQHRFAVVEMGTSARGEIEHLAKVARPDVGVLTLVAAAHTERIGTIDDVAVEKGALLAALPASGLAVVNGDDLRARSQLTRTHARDRLTYGFSPENDYRILARETDAAGRSRVAIARRGQRMEMSSPLLGDAGALALAASLAVAEWISGRLLEEPELSSALMATSSDGAGRLSLVPLSGGTLLIDDSYNANPASMRSSIATAAELAQLGRRRLVLVLGEMLELGELSQNEHRELGRLLGSYDVAEIFSVGKDARYLAEEAKKSGKRAHHLESSELAIEPVLSAIEPGDLVLVKGSRGVATDKIVRAFARRLVGGQS